MQRSQIIRDVAAEDVSNSDTLLLRLDLGLGLAVNGEFSKFKQVGQQIVNRIKEYFTKLDPRGDLVTMDECTKLVNGHFHYKFLGEKKLKLQI